VAGSDLTVVQRLARAGLRRGLTEGSRAWLSVGVAATLLRVAKWIVTEPPETVYAAELKPGESIEIRTVRRST